MKFVVIFKDDMVCDRFIQKSTLQVGYNLRSVSAFLITSKHVRKAARKRGVTIKDSNDNGSYKSSPTKANVIRQIPICFVACSKSVLQCF